MTLTETVAAIADAIREKTGKSDLIAPVNFAEEIKGITAGGGESGGGLSYFAVDTSILGADVAVMYGSFLAKVVLPEGIGIQSTAAIFLSMGQDALTGLKAIATDVNAKMEWFGQIVPIWGSVASTIDEFISQGVLTPITEAEFYDLNA